MEVLFNFKLNRFELEHMIHLINEVRQYQHVNMVHVTFPPVFWLFNQCGRSILPYSLAMTCQAPLYWNQFPPLSAMKKNQNWTSCPSMRTCPYHLPGTAASGPTCELLEEQYLQEKQARPVPLNQSCDLCRTNQDCAISTWAEFAGAESANRSAPVPSCYN